MAYTKLFSSIVTSTIWLETPETKVVWITMLAMADKNGEVQGSVPGLARIAGVTVEACRTALDRFLSPDPDSRTPDDNGKRIKPMDGGWKILNHAKYRAMDSREDRKEKDAERKRDARGRMRTHADTCGQVWTDADTADMSANVRNEVYIAEADTEAEAEADNTSSTPQSEPPSDDGFSFLVSQGMSHKAAAAVALLAPRAELVNAAAWCRTAGVRNPMGYIRKMLEQDQRPWLSKARQSDGWSPDEIKANVLRRAKE